VSELFRGGDTLMPYHYMFPRHAADRRPGPTRGAMAEVPLAEGPCPSCTALIDMWEGTMPEVLSKGVDSSCGTPSMNVPLASAHAPDGRCRRAGVKHGAEA